MLLQTYLSALMARWFHDTRLALLKESLVLDREGFLRTSSWTRLASRSDASRTLFEHLALAMPPWFPLAISYYV